MGQALDAKREDRVFFNKKKKQEKPKHLHDLTSSPCLGWWPAERFYGTELIKTSTRLMMPDASQRKEEIIWPGEFDG